jgi:predicted GH43/DUF377 family glycosyl hydrolase
MLTFRDSPEVFPLTLPSSADQNGATLPQHFERLPARVHITPVSCDGHVSKPSLVLSERNIELNLNPRAVALNGSIARINNYIVLAYRLDTLDSMDHPSSQIAMVQLDDELQPIGPTSILETRIDLALNPTAEDPRLVVHQGRLFVIYNSTMDGKVQTNRAMFLAEMGLHGPKNNLIFHLVRRKRLEIASEQQRTEKNWTPFSTAGQLHFIYNTNPPHVFAMGEDEWQLPGSAVTLAEVCRSKIKIKEPLGQMRGGTAAIFDAERNVFTSFFHTQLVINSFEKNYCALYFAGLYTFSPTAPFEILEVLPFPIVPTGSYREHYRSSEKSSWVTYPAGFVRIGDIVHLSYGQNDVCIGIVSLNYKGLMESMLAI